MKTSFQAFQQRENLIQQKMSEETANRSEIESNVHGDMLTENPSVARSSSNRVLPDRWKGMDKAQLEEFYKGQRQQIMENQVTIQKHNTNQGRGVVAKGAFPLVNFCKDPQVS